MIGVPAAKAGAIFNWRFYRRGLQYGKGNAGQTGVLQSDRRVLYG